MNLDINYLQLVLMYILIPFLIFILFSLFVKRLYHKNDRQFQLSIAFWNGSLIVIFSFVGYVAMVIGISELITITTILAQALPLTIAIYLYSDGMASFEKISYTNRINNLEERVSKLETFRSKKRQ